MATLTDVFAPDAFDAYTLTAAIQKMPHAPTTIAELGIFKEIPIPGTLVAVEEDDGVLALVPTTARGGPGIPRRTETALCGASRCRTFSSKTRSWRTMF